MGKIAEYLAKEFFSVNCSSCAVRESDNYFKDDLWCDECSVRWHLSNEVALELEKEILELKEE